MTQLNDIFSQAELDGMLCPPEEATPPPVAFYTSQELYDLEMEHIFLKDWIWVGHAEHAKNPGDYFTFTYASEPILVTRDETGALHAFSNVCRHRGTVVAHGEGSCKSFTCPYHTWTYGLDGKLLGAPFMEGVKDFDLADYGLKPLRVENWNGNVMVNFDPDCQPLADSLGDMNDYFENFDMGSLVCTERRIYDVPCNWKMIVENNVEGYHLIGVHQAPGEYMALENWRTIEGHGLYDILAGEFEAPLTMNIEGSGGAPQTGIQGLNQAEQRRVYFVTLYPNNLWTLQPDSIVCAHMIPNGVGRTKWVADFHYPEATIQHPDFAELSKAAYEGVESIVQQDYEILEQTYKAYQSRVFTPGRLSLHERSMNRFARYVLSRVSGREFSTGA